MVQGSGFIRIYNRCLTHSSYMAVSVAPPPDHEGRDHAHGFSVGWGPSHIHPTKIMKSFHHSVWMDRNFKFSSSKAPVAANRGLHTSSFEKMQYYMGSSGV